MDITRRLISNNILFTKNVLHNVKPIKSLIRNNRCFSTGEVPVKEIEIPTKWGKVTGKLWGSGNERPILALHGWQDNSGTWDPLAPIIAQKRPVLAIDFPGHGTSSWIPPGLMYYPWELVSLIIYLKDFFKWEKISLLSHSMGSIASFRYVCVFPDEVDLYIAVDSLIYDDYPLDLVVEKYPTVLKKLQQKQNRLDQEPPSYTIDEMANIWHLGTRKSVTVDSAKILMKRGAKESKDHPNKYYFSRDPRLKHSLFIPEQKKYVQAMGKRMKCPTIYFKAVDSPYASDDFSVYMREFIEANNPNFVSHFVPGTHHVHLNEPEKLSPLILDFMDKIKPSS